jgi:hypothetical protein
MDTKCVSYVYHCIFGPFRSLSYLLIQARPLKIRIAVEVKDFIQAFPILSSKSLTPFSGCSHFLTILVSFCLSGNMGPVMESI